MGAGSLVRGLGGLVWVRCMQCECVFMVFSERCSRSLCSSVDCPVMASARGLVDSKGLEALSEEGFGSLTNER